ncbi:hypothetical protein FA15DRAFT_683254 [Coprinopsis marcescibilis]|uniref:Uncharacterized protein n=1 Tax=Coprinopsis marcescibilis TaxID=230819 RepID=A0A5C3KEV1_COPMA|nr:hypothetical protein FA15DRAFT_683254 [Coprinopsis marcescibilis]
MACDTLARGYTSNSRQTYGAGLLSYHIWCDMHRAPASADLMLSFLSSLAGLYSGSTLRSYLAGVKAEQERDLWTEETLVKLRDHLDLNNSLDAAVFACATTKFWSVSQLSEFTVSSIKSFDPTRRVKRSQVTESTAVRPLGVPVTTLRIPSTKCTIVEDELVHWSRQEGAADPQAAFAHHFVAHDPSPNAHLFTYKDRKGGTVPLSKAVFMTRVRRTAKGAGIGVLYGHGLRIDVPFDVVKGIGRWAGEAFTRYLRDHATILAPYLQATPVLEPFTRVSMPPVR